MGLPEVGERSLEKREESRWWEILLQDPDPHRTAAGAFPELLELKSSKSYPRPVASWMAQGGQKGRDLLSREDSDRPQ